MDIQDAYNLTHNGILALARAERQGIRVDMKHAQDKHRELTRLIDELNSEFIRTKFYKYWEKSRGGRKVNIGSNQQLASYLYATKKIKPIKETESGQGSTDEEALEALGIPELNNLLRIRKLKKLRDTYLHSFISESVDGILHPVFNLHMARTYRSSSDSPNFQNIPIRDEEAKEIVRTCLYPRKGYQLLEIDFSGLEVCIAACYHKDPTMIKYIKDPKSDMHADMAKQIFLVDDFDKKKKAYKALRFAAKNGFVFPQFYGDYYANNVISLSGLTGLPLKGKYKSGDGLELPDGNHLGHHLISKGIKSVNDFTNHLKKIESHFWRKRFPVYANWKKKWWAQYQKIGSFDMYTGFHCSGVMGKNDAINYPVQGAAFHCLLWSFIQLDKLMIEERWKTRLVGQIHDSILFDVKPKELPHILESAKKVTEENLPKAWDWINVPLLIDAELCEVDQSWYYKKEIDLT